MNKIFEAIGAHAYLPEYEKAEMEILRKADEEFVSNNIVGVVGNPAEAACKSYIENYDSDWN